MLKHRNPAVAAFEAKRKADYETAVATVREIIATCEHDRVIQSGNRRLCLACGYEESNRYYWWPGETTDGGLYEFVAPPGRTTILNSEFVARGDVVNYRVHL